MKRSQVFVSVLAALGSAALPEAHAQDGAVEEVLVTGSRIRSTDGMTTATPVTTLSSDELSNMAPGNMIDAFDQLPQFLDNDSPRTALSKADSAGASNVNLRGLGSQRTLVLLNGRRIVPSNRHSTTDISVFPQALVRNVEAVTGGASAAYGSDAVAGVVNFILDTNFTGVKTEIQGGVTDRSDDESWKASVAAGTPIGDKMHLVMSLDFLETNGTGSFDKRDWYQRQGRVTNPEWAATGQGPRLITANDVVSTEASFGGIIHAPGTSLHRLHFQPDGTATPFIVSDLSSAGAGTHTQSVTNGGSGDNYRDDRPFTLSPPSERGSSYFNLDYDVNENLTFSASLLYGYQRTETAGTLPLGFGVRGATIYQDNAFLSDDMRQAMVDEGIASFRLDRWHSNEDLGRDIFVNHNHTVSGSFGFDGVFDTDGFFDDWRYDAYYQWGRNRNRLSFRDFLRTDLMPLAVDAVRDPDTNEIVCNVTLYDPARECVPLNLFGRGVASREAVDFVTGDMYVLAETNQRVAEFTLDGQVAEGWAGPIFMAFGASYREDRIDQTLGPDDIMALDGLPGNDPANGIRGVPSQWMNRDIVFAETDIQPIDGGFDVKEVFAETTLPLVSDAGLVQDANLSLGVRWADYSGSGSVQAWKVGGDMWLGETVRLRTTYSRDVRAGNLAERFDRQQRAVPLEDPLFNNEQIIASQIFGGNPNVDPEEADTLTFGVVYQPAAVENFSMSVDWYDIQLDGRIGSWGAQNIVDDCSAGAVDMCALIERHPLTNNIVRVNDLYLNLHESRVQGTDLELRYNTDFGGDQSISTRLIASYLIEDSVTNRGQPKIDLVGTESRPEYTLLASVTYTNGPFRVYVQERYRPGTIIDRTFVEGVDIDDNSLDAAYYTDLRLSYDFDRGAGWSVYGNINNLFDQDPVWPANASRFSGTALPTRDAVGRNYVVGMKFNF